MGSGTDLLKRISEASNLYAFNSIHSCHGVFKTIHLIVVKSFRELFGAEDKHPLTYFLGRRSTSITATTNADISPYQKNYEKLKKEFDDYKVRHPDNVGIKNGKPCFFRPETGQKLPWRTKRTVFL